MSGEIFFYSKEFPKSWDDSGNITDLINQTDTTIRAVDNGYMYVYTPHESIVEIIKKNYEIEEIKTDFLENLDYPY